MIYMSFLSKVITVFFRNKPRYDYKNNHKCGILANFWLYIISKINCKTLVVMSYISLQLQSKKI